MICVAAAIGQVIPGTQLTVQFSVYLHHGIYVGAGRVIHYAGWIRGRLGLVEEVSLDEFTEGRPFSVGLNPCDADCGQDIVRRARSRLGERRYDLLKNNCEHFCLWCLCGEARSIQIEVMARPLRIAIRLVLALWTVPELLIRRHARDS